MIIAWTAHSRVGGEFPHTLKLFNSAHAALALAHLHTERQTTTASRGHSQQHLTSAPNFVESFKAATSALNSTSNQSRVSSHRWTQQPQPPSNLTSKDPYIFIPPSRFSKTAAAMTSSAFSSNSKLATPFTTPRDEQRAQQLKEWKFDCAIARSEGKEPPPRPRSALVRPSISSAISNKHVKRQRVPMGMTQVSWPTFQVSCDSATS